MKNFLLIVLFFLSFTVKSDSLFKQDNIKTSNPLSSWIEAIPPRFDNLEQFFLRSECSAIVGVTYLYNIDRNHWLPFEEAKKLYPNKELYLSGDNCELTTTPKELKTTLDVNLDSHTGYVLFFFDVFYNAQGERSSFHPDYDRKMIEIYDELSAFNDIPKYHLKINSIGLTPQK